MTHCNERSRFMKLSDLIHLMNIDNDAHLTITLVIIGMKKIL